jgi:sec-independent protein translocase protein TatA
MFGIGGGELLFIIFIALMLFGSDKIPDVARTMGKAMAQFKNATNEIKSEIQKGADANGIDTSMKQLTSTFTEEVEKVKSNIELSMCSYISYCVNSEVIREPIKVIILSKPPIIAANS